MIRRRKTPRLLPDVGEWHLRRELAAAGIVGVTEAEAAIVATGVVVGAGQLLARLVRVERAVVVLLPGLRGCRDGQRRLRICRSSVIC